MEADWGVVLAGLEGLAGITVAVLGVAAAEALLTTITSITMNSRRTKARTPGASAPGGANSV